jgi:hypothetical protein
LRTRTACQDKEWVMNSYDDDTQGHASINVNETVDSDDE